MINKKKIIVVGGNAAGPAAAAKAKRTNPSADVKLFEASPFISTGTCELPFLLSGEIEDYKKIVFFNEKSFFEKKGVEVFTRHLVQNINDKDKEIAVTDLESGDSKNYQFDKLILATGSKAKSFSGYDNVRNIFNLKSVSDYLEIAKYSSENRVDNILVIGAGYIGLEVADAFTKIGKSVTIVEKANTPLGVMDEMVQESVKDLLNTKVETFYNSNVNLQVEDNVVKSANINGRIKDYDLVITALGVKPNNVLSETLNLDQGESGGLKVTNKMLTSNFNIFAAGDNIEVKNKITRKFSYYPFAQIAHNCGHIAGANAAGGNLLMEDYIPNFALHIFDTTITQVGLTEQEAKNNFYNSIAVSVEGYNLVHVMPRSRKVIAKLVVDKNRRVILGATFIGGSEVTGYADIISSMIYNKNCPTTLENISYNYSPPVSPFKNILSILGRKVKEKL